MYTGMTVQKIIHPYLKLSSDAEKCSAFPIEIV